MQARSRQRGVDEKAALDNFLAKRVGLPSINLDAFRVAPEIIGLVARPTAIKHRVIPVSRSVTGETVVVALADPANTEAIEAVAKETGLMVELVQAWAADGPREEHGGCAFRRNPR